MASVDNISARGLVSIRHAVEILGVSVNTVRNYVNKGDLVAYRVGNKGHRRFKVSDLKSYLGEEEVASTVKTLIYARVSTSRQAKNDKDGKGQLASQVARLKEYANKHYAGRQLVAFQDCASSMNWNREGLTKLLEEVLTGMHDGSVLLCSHPDRLSRHVRELLEKVFQSHKIEVVFTEQDASSDEELLTNDLLSIVHLYSIKMYSKRASDRARKSISSETMARGLELLQSGLSIKATHAKLAEEGHDISIQRVAKYLYRSHAKLEKIGCGKSTAKEYAEQFVEKGNSNYRLPIGRVYRHYCEWAKKENKEVVSLAVFRRAFSFRMTNFKNEQSFIGARVKGQNLHYVAAAHRTKFSNSLDAVTHFLDELSGTTVVRSKLFGDYREFCKTHGMEPELKTSFFRLIQRLGARKRLSNKGWVLDIA